MNSRETWKANRTGREARGVRENARAAHRGGTSINEGSSGVGDLTDDDKTSDKEYFPSDESEDSSVYISPSENEQDEAGSDEIPFGEYYLIL